MIWMGKMSEALKVSVNMFVRLTSFLLCMLVCIVTAESDIPEPVARFTFDGESKQDAEFVKGDLAEIVEGGVKGYALKTGATGSHVWWELSNSGFDWEKGTISFWFQPLDWEEKGRTRFWLQTGWNFNLLHVAAPEISSWSKLNCRFNLKRGVTHLWNGFTDWENGKWYFVTLTWGDRESVLYLDGRVDAEGGGLRGPPPLTEGEILESRILRIGHSPLHWQHKDSSGAVENSLMDEVEIRDKPLSMEQVRRLYFTQRPRP